MGKVKSEKLIATYGDKILDAGFTSVPNLLLEHQEELGLDDKELLLFIKSSYLSYKNKPIKDVELKMISSPATLNRIRRNLKDKKFLETKIFYERSQDGKLNGTGIEYDWKGLLNKLRGIADTKFKPKNQNDDTVESPSNQNDNTVTIPNNHIDDSVKNDLNEHNIKPDNQNDCMVTSSSNGMSPKYRLIEPNNHNDCPVQNTFSPSHQNGSLLLQNDWTINRLDLKDNILYYNTSNINNKDLFVENFEKSKIDAMTNDEYTNFIKTFVKTNKKNITERIPEWQKQYDGINCREVMNDVYAQCIKNPEKRIYNFIETVENHLKKKYAETNGTGKLFDMPIHCPICKNKKKRNNLVVLIPVNSHFHCPECMNDFDNKLKRIKKQKESMLPETNEIYAWYLENNPYVKQGGDYVSNPGKDKIIINSIVKRVQGSKNGDTVPFIKKAFETMFKDSFYTGICDHTIETFAGKFNVFANKQKINETPNWQKQQKIEDDNAKKELLKAGIDYDAEVKRAERRRNRLANQA